MQHFSQFLNNKLDIIAWLNHYHVKNYTLSPQFYRWCQRRCANKW